MAVYCSVFAEISPHGNNPHTGINYTQSHAQCSHPNLRPNIYTALHPRRTSGCPFLLVPKTDRKKGDNSFNPSMNARLLSRGDIEKMLQAFPQQSAKQRGPWEIFYSGAAKFCTPLTHGRAHANCSFYERGIFVLYFSLVAAARIFIFSRTVLF